MAFSSFAGKVITKSQPVEYMTALNERADVLGLSNISEPSGGRNAAHTSLVKTIRSHISGIGWGTASQHRNLIIDETNPTSDDEVFLQDDLSQWADEDELLTAAGHAGGWIDLAGLPIEDPSPWEQLGDVFAVLKKYARNIPVNGLDQNDNHRLCGGWPDSDVDVDCIWDNVVADTCTGECNGEPVNDTPLVEFPIYSADTDVLKEDLRYEYIYQVAFMSEAPGCPNNPTGERAFEGSFPAVDFTRAEIDLSSIAGSLIKFQYSVHADSEADCLQDADIESTPGGFTETVLAGSGQQSFDYEITSGLTFGTVNNIDVTHTNQVDFEPFPFTPPTSYRELCLGFGGSDGGSWFATRPIQTNSFSAKDRNLWVDITDALTYG